MRSEFDIVSRRLVLQGVAGFTLLAAARAGAATAQPATKLTLSAEGGRAVEVWRWVPTGRRRGVIAFSHGALSAPWKYEKLLSPWVAAGYEILAPLHVDSTDHPQTKAFAGLASWKARIEDMRAVAQAVRAERFVAAGHSYGGLTALTMGGAQAMMPQGLTGSQRLPRVSAVLAFSPPGITPPLIDAAGYAKLAVPALIQTGDRDIPMGSTDPAGWRGHLAAYEAAPPGGDRYALVLDGVDHYFGGLICREIEAERQTAQLATAVELSTLFMNAFLAKDAKSRRVFDGHLAAAGPVRLTRK
ncbi:alpha-beta hydrolase superfamily lysophospholipase [Sphingomonas zeicaulis]|uniref:alpha/beta hydrolase family protein n=1 Tax=Sphingomonas zeicaulis TaxID=1632740 RepID=UPI003D216992